MDMYYGSGTFNGAMFRGVRDPWDAYLVSPHRDLHVLVLHSYEGVAVGADHIIGPVYIGDLPCRDRIRDLIEGREQLPVLPMPQTCFHPSIDQHTPPGGASESSMFVRMRPGNVHHTYDVIGDGTEVIHYTHDGLPLGLELRSYERGVFADPAEGYPEALPIPFRREMADFRQSHGVPVIGRDAPFSSRPVLVGWDWSPDSRAPLKLRIALGPGPDIPPRPNRGRTRRMSLNGGSAVLDFGSREANNKTLSVEASDTGGGADMRGVPARAGVEAILRHQGVRIRGSRDEG